MVWCAVVCVRVCACVVCGGVRVCVCVRACVRGARSPGRGGVPSMHQSPPFIDTLHGNSAAYPQDIRQDTA